MEGWLNNFALGVEGKMSDLEVAYEKVYPRLSKLIDQPRYRYDSSDKDRWQQVNNIKTNLITLIKERSISENLSVKEYEWRVRKAFDLVDDIKSSLTKSADLFEDKAKKKHWSLQKTQLIWFHMSIEVIQGEDMEKLPEIDYQSLKETASSYLSNSWMQHDYIDWILLDALIYAEIKDFREQHLMGATYGDLNWSYVFHGGDSNKQWWTELLLPKVIFSLRYIIPATTIAILFYFNLEKATVIVGAIYTLYLLLRLVCWPKRNSQKREITLRKDKSEKIYEWMGRVYICCSTPIISPGVIRKMLYDGAEDGRLFNGVVYALVDSILLKNTVFLKPEFLEELDIDQDAIRWEWEDQEPNEND